MGLLMGWKHTAAGLFLAGLGGAGALAESGGVPIGLRAGIVTPILHGHGKGRVGAPAVDVHDSGADSVAGANQQRNGLQARGAVIWEVGFFAKIVGYLPGRLGATRRRNVALVISGIVDHGARFFVVDADVESRRAVMIATDAWRDVSLKIRHSLLIGQDAEIVNMDMAGVRVAKNIFMSGNNR